MPGKTSPEEWWFYHVEHTRLEDAVAQLVDQCLSRRWRVVISGDPETLDRLDDALWTWRDDCFLPHGRPGPRSGAQPVLLAEDGAPDNGAPVAIVLNGREPRDAPFKRCLVVFRGDDEVARGRARGQFKAAQAAGLITKYVQQSPQGGWVTRAGA